MLCIAPACGARGTLNGAAHPAPLPAGHVQVEDLGTPDQVLQRIGNYITGEQQRFIA